MLFRSVFTPELILGTAWRAQDYRYSLEVTLQRVKTPVGFKVYTLTILKGHLKQFLETKY